MNEKEFATLAAAALRQLDQALRDEPDLEVDLAGDILTIEFEDGEKYVINSHSAAQQVWMSANLRAWHFSWDGAAWKDSRSGAELFAEAGQLVAGKLAGK